MCWRCVTATEIERINTDMANTEGELVEITEGTDLHPGDVLRKVRLGENGVLYSPAFSDSVVTEIGEKEIGLSRMEASYDSFSRRFWMTTQDFRVSVEGVRKEYRLIRNFFGAAKNVGK